MNQANKQTPWGYHLVLNLYQCNPDTIRSEDKIKEFVIKLCDLIEMKRFGEPLLVRFGDNPIVTGYSLCQFIETSSVSGHFAENTNAVYLDIFSCKYFNSNKAMKFCEKFFDSKSNSHLFLDRD